MPRMGGIRDALRRSPRLVAGAAAAAIGVGAIAAVVIGAMTGPTPATVAPTATPVPTEVADGTSTPDPTERPTPAPRRSPAPTATPTVTAACPLDGMPLAEGTEITEPALAVQIENDPDARPARNLSRADLVVEATVEGDVTRFTAIYLCDETEGMTGPTRSARYYNIDLWQDLRVLTVGYGASPGAVQRFTDAGMPYPNGIEEGWPWYRRHGAKPAPHNLYVDLEAMRDALATHDRLRALAGDVGPLRPPFTFDDRPALPVDGRTVSRIEIATNPYWRFGYAWDDARGAYLRSDAGVAIRDEATGSSVAPVSVLVQWVTQETVYGDPDPAGNPRRLQHLVGSGTGVLYTLGRAYELRWERPTVDDGTRWTLAETGAALVLPPGQVWWEILPIGSTVDER